MRNISFYFILFTLLFYSNCAEEKELSFSEVNITTNTNNIVEINIPKAIGDADVSEKINTTINNLITTSLEIDESETNSVKSVEESINAFNKEYETFKSDFPESPLIWESQIDGEVTYQSNTIITIAITNYQNTGGAHGILTVTLLNFDAQTGVLLKNDDLFSDISSFKTLAKDYFVKEISDKKEMYFEPDNFVLPKNIGYNEEGLILLYNSYEIAPYSTGLTDIYIPFEKVNYLLNHL